MPAWGERALLAVTFSTADDRICYYINDTLLRTWNAPGATIQAGNGAVQLNGFRGGWGKGIYDNAILFNRILDQPSIARWAERRWPQK